MNELARSRPKLPLVLLAGFVLGLGAAGTAAAQGNPNDEKKCRISLHFDGNGNPDGINAPSPDPLRLKRNKHWAHWHLDVTGNASLLILMKSETPFDAPPDCSNKDCKSNPPTGAVRPDPYGYTVKVTLPDGRVLTLDPGIIVDP